MFAFSATCGAKITRVLNVLGITQVLENARALGNNKISNWNQDVSKFRTIPAGRHGWVLLDSCRSVRLIM